VVVFREKMNTSESYLSYHEVRGQQNVMYVHRYVFWLWDYIVKNEKRVAPVCMKS
jgi:hypothetical protein